MFSSVILAVPVRLRNDLSSASERLENMIYGEGGGFRPFFQEWRLEELFPEVTLTLFLFAQQGALGHLVGVHPFRKLKKTAP